MKTTLNSKDDCYVKCLQSLKVIPFQANEKYYCYDFSSNDFLKVAKCLFDLFCLLSAMPLASHDSRERLLSRAGSEIAEAQSKGFFVPGAAAFPSYNLSTEELSDLLTDRLGALILSVTESCNLMCKYCSYSGIYNLNRIYSNRNMTWEVAKRSLDYYLTRCQKPTIGFFGGEPLLCIDLIEQCIKYSNSKSQNQINYNTSTNGILLSERIAGILADNNVNVGISIDGPEELHDRHRVTSSGRPTFKRVWDNIQRLYRIYPEWASTHIYFLVVVAPPYDLRSLSRFIGANRAIF